MKNKEQPDTNRGIQFGQIPDAIEGAYIVLLAQNAFLISKPIFEIGTSNTEVFFHVTIVAIALINFFNIAAGWLSDRLISYTSTNLFWDIVSLATFFVLVQALLDTYNNGYINIYYVLVITSIIYILLSVINIVWNNIEIRNLEDSRSQKSKAFKKVLQRANILNYIALFFAFLLGLASLNPSYKWLPLGAFVLWSANWLFVIVYYTWSSVRLK